MNRTIIGIFMVCVIMLAMVGCSNNNSQTDIAHEVIDNTTAIDLAKNEFHSIFAEFEDLEIDQIATSSRTDDSNQIVVEITYSSSNGDGTYGFEYTKDENANYTLKKHGENISVYNLTE
ncbi:MAG: hypothetical protein R3Y35_09175 [Clostridia bacterium]